MRFYAGIFLLAQAVSGALGPNRLYAALYGSTYNLTDPGGISYSISPYSNIYLQPDVLLGNFQTYAAVGSVYAYQAYTGGSTSGGCGGGRSFSLEVDCGATLNLDTVIENPPCYYTGTLNTPDACGVNMQVGQEAASPTGTPTPSTSPLGLFTMFPSASQTATRTASGTPLFMITAWPTTSPVNVSATSTPLFYMTPYPSYDPLNGTLAVLGLMSGATGTTATILGAVAVGGIGIFAIVFAVKHFRGGGTVGGLFKIAMANRGKLNAVLEKVPGVPDSVKKAIANPNSVLPPEAQKMLAMASSPHAAIDKLDLPESVKAEMKKHVPSSGEELLNKVTTRRKAIPAPVIAEVDDDGDEEAPTNSVVNTPSITALSQKHIVELLGAQIKDPEAIKALMAKASASSVTDLDKPPLSPQSVLVEVPAATPTVSPATTKIE